MSGAGARERNLGPKARGGCRCGAAGERSRWPRRSAEAAVRGDDDSEEMGADGRKLRGGAGDPRERAEGRGRTERETMKGSEKVHIEKEEPRIPRDRKLNATYFSTELAATSGPPLQPLLPKAATSTP
jgi:hypothetical protein